MAELIPVLIIVALLALNALFVAAEFAIVGVPRASIERRAQQGSRIARVVRSVLARPAPAGSLHRHRAARHHRRQPGARHVRRARARRLDLPPRLDVRRRRQLGRVPHAGDDSQRRLPDLPAHRPRRDDPEVAGAAERRAIGAVDHAADADDDPGGLPAGGRAERGRQPDAAPRRHQPRRRIEGPSLLAGGARPHRRRERRGRPAPRRSRPDAARAVRVQRHLGARGDGAACPRHRHRDRLRARGRPPHRAWCPGTRATRCSTATSITSSATSTSRSWWRSSRPGAWSPAATRTRFRRCRTPRRSTTCWPRSAATPRRWRWSSTSTAAPPA